MSRRSFGFKELLQLVETTYLKNRTIVSKDIEPIFQAIEEKTGLDIYRHRYTTGEDYSTWLIPKQWDVKEAWLKDAKGNIIASYSEHPLFVCTYSKGIHLNLSKEELCEHVYSDPKQPDAYSYNWRYAMDYRLQLKDWGISLPLNVVEEMDETSTYEIFIDVDTKDGEMLIGEIEKKGKTDNIILFLSDYCHPGQVNDSYTGIMLFLKIMNDLLANRDTYFTYKLLIMPETIGSAAYITQNKEELHKIKGAVFSEMIGWGESWYIKKSRRQNTYMDLIAEDCVKKFECIGVGDFYSLIGNDEYMFDSVQAGIPSLSIQKHPYVEYHTSNDEPSRVKLSNLEFAEKIVEHMVHIIETDRVYKFIHAVPFWMTRFDLYSDDQYEPEDFMKRLKIVYDYLDGESSILEIANKMSLKFEEVHNFVSMLVKENLVSEIAHPLGVR